MRTIGKTVALILAIAAVVFLVGESDVMAQCSMCRLSLSGARSAEFIRNFNLGVLVLLVPPVVMFCTIFVVLRRFSRSGHSR